MEIAGALVSNIRFAGSPEDVIFNETNRAREYGPMIKVGLVVLFNVYLL